MLEQITLEQALAFVFVGGGVALLLERIPAWVEWKSPLKALIVIALNGALSFIFPAVLAQIPKELLTQTLDKLIITAFLAAASFVIHHIDKLLAGLAKLTFAKLNK